MIWFRGAVGGVLVSGLVLFEGLPGSGKSTNASDLASWLTQGGAVVDHWPESRPDHPVDLDQVAVLTDHDRERLGAAGPGWDRMLSEVIEPTDGAWLVRSPHERDLPSALKVALQDLEVYNGDINPALHGRVLRESWRQFGAAVPPAAIQVWECVLIQNPVCAFIARFDRPYDELADHVRSPAETVLDQNPALVYLDPGDPEEVLRRAAAERPAAWVDFVVAYHTEQGYGRANGLRGFDGYVEFMRHRRDLELALIADLSVPCLIVETSTMSREKSTASIRDFARRHLRDNLA
jgi:hypothetical protein